MLEIHKYASNTNTNTHKKWPKSCFGSDIASQQGFGDKIRVHRVLEKIEIRRGFGFHWGFWIENPSGVCWFWLRIGVLDIKVHMEHLKTFKTGLKSGQRYLTMSQSFDECLSHLKNI